MTKPDVQRRPKRCEVCGAPRLYMMYEGFVKTGRRLWYCEDHRPDFRALRMAYFDQRGHWPPVGKP
jgi:hypothetical protein